MDTNLVVFAFYQISSAIIITVKLKVMFTILHLCFYKQVSFFFTLYFLHTSLSAYIIYSEKKKQLSIIATFFN